MSRSPDQSPFPARDPAVQAWRNIYYNPTGLRSEDSTLPLIMDSMDELVNTSVSGRSYSTDGSITWHSYGRVFPQQGSSDDETLLTAVNITNRVYPERASVREDWRADVTAYESDGNPLYGRSYKLQRYAGGIAHLELAETLEGLGQALVADDASQQSYGGWRPATEYDAEVLFDQLGVLLNLQSANGSD